MAGLPHILRDMNCHFHDQSYAGLCNAMKVPKIAVKTTDFVLAGFAGDIERSLGKLEKLECEVTISKYPSKLMGYIGDNGARDQQFTFSGAVDTGDSISTVIIRQQGLWKSFEHGGDMKPEEEAVSKFAIAVEVYNLEIDGVEIFHIDKQNNIFRVNGVDRNEQIRAALGQ